ncbi:acyl-CoA N-acyltransferase [Schizophyllum amplum]|uniref:Acyl-CoA N-acyltransferase n=1 Tax=Schizophyllum amplum TaxID=97359 RepID=A0A550C726_9AGAR|nr:acyl-CoA N-acyltransferase [Auriculariopsis ampla]
MSSFAVRPARPEDFTQIAIIANYYIENSLATFRTERVDRAALLDTFYSVVEQRLPYIVSVAFDDPDEPFVLGYAYASRYRPERDAYRHTAELSIYVHPDHLSAGIGSLMLDNLLGLLRQSSTPSLLLGPVAEESTPIRQVLAVMALDTEGYKGGYGQRDWYVKRGFVQVGQLREVGHKFGRWIDTIILQLSLHSDGGATSH